MDIESRRRKSEILVSFVEGDITESDLINMIVNLEYRGNMFKSFRRFKLLTKVKLKRISVVALADIVINLENQLNIKTSCSRKKYLDDVELDKLTKIEVENAFRKISIFENKLNKKLEDMSYDELTNVLVSLKINKRKDLERIARPIIDYYHKTK